ncbi:MULTISPECIES: hypothetical protein [unclassified Nocardioides]|uniref:hypothetical protein n=1 Tax=unclassified Nocardioides TaxID=2615069 RepID=UPI0006F88F43|nr:MULTISPECIES: hypothetical protein [unclassified Nocardioides]KRA31071.1 hypothetical protein ASD81_16410 [Nocardioides sp. Root614]KRA87691.1 hypothetical protein ASD84_16680 [Nocardioides sp. Root682]
MVLLWWGIAFTALYAVSLGLLIDVVPPPPPTWSPARVAEFYQQHSDRVLFGAVIASFSGAFMLPISVVAAVQSARQEPGRPVWSIFMFAGGTFTSVFLVLPPVFFGVAAYRPDRSAEITATLHDIALLSLFTTVQYFIFFGVTVAISCLRKHEVKGSPFPRTYGYFTIWCTLMFEVGGVAFLFKTGPFAWNGLFIFWIPFFFFFIWLATLCVLLHRAIAAQQRIATA